MSREKMLEVILRLKDEDFKKGLVSADRQVQQIGKKFANVGQVAAAGFLAMGGAVAGLAKTFSDFESSMANVSTLVDTNAESMDAMGKSVLDIARRTPVAIGDLSSALYDVRSAGIDAGRAMDVLETSARLAVAGLSSTKEATNIMTSALNAFKAEGLSADQTANILFKTVKYGKTTIAELSQAFGATAPLVQSAGVALADFSAATAALTTVGVPASQAQNSLRAAVVALKKPTEEMDTIFKNLGVRSGPELIKTSGGLGEAFKRIYEEASRSGIVLEKATGRVEAAAAITSLATSTNAAYVDTLADMASGSDVLTEAFDKQNQTFSAVTQRMINTIQALAIELGQALVPALSVVANMVTDLALRFTSLPQPIKEFVANGLLVGTVLSGIVAAIGLTVGALAGMASSVMGVVAAMGGMATVGATVGAVLTGPVALAVAGIALALGGLGVAWYDMAKTAELANRSVEDVGRALDDSTRKLARETESVEALAHEYDTLQAQTNKTEAEKQRMSRIMDVLSDKFPGQIDYIMRLAKEYGSLERAARAARIQMLATERGKAIDEDIDRVNKARKGITDNPFNWQKTSLVTNKLSPAAQAQVDALDAQKKALVDRRENLSSELLELIKVQDQFSQAVTGDYAGGGGSGSSGKSKKVKDTTEKAQISELSHLSESLTRALNNNRLALDEVVAGMGAYAKEGEKLSAQLAKLQKDEEALVATRANLESVSLKGKAEEERIKKLAEVNEKIRQNHTDQVNLENARVKILADAWNKQLAKEGEVASARVKLEQSVAKARSDLTRKQEEHELQNLKRLLDQKKISQQDYLAQVSAIVEGQAEREAQLIDTQIENLRSKHDMLLQSQGVSAETIQLEEQMLLLELRKQELAETTRHNLENTRLQLAANKTEVERFGAAIVQLSNNFASNLVTSILQGNASIKDSLKALAVQATQSLLNGVFRIAGEGFAKMLKDGEFTTTHLSQAFSALSRATSTIFKGLSDFVSKIFGGILSFAVNTFKRMFGAAKSANVAAATTKVSEWAINAAAAVAGIPIVGPILAKAAFASAKAMGMAEVGFMKGAGMASFAVGTPRIPEDMIAQIHKDEMIIPATFAQAIRSGELALSGGNRGGEAASGQTIVINFEGANFNGVPREWVDELEQLFIEKIKTKGSALFGGA